MIAVWLLAVALAGDGTYVVLRGDTVASIAEGLGAPETVPALREANGLAAGEEPTPGSVLVLPDILADITCRPSYVRDHHGTGTLTTAAGDVTPLRPFAPIGVGDTVCTDADAFAQLVLSVDLEGGGQDAVTLLPGTCVRLRASNGLVGGRNTHVLLDRGALAVDARDEPSSLIVQTAAGVTVGEQGGFRVAVEDGGTRTEAVSRPAQALAAGVQVDLDAGFGSRTPVGEAPGDPVALPPAPTLVAPEGGAELRVPDFAWTPVPEGFGYVLEIGTDADFGVPVWREVRTGDRWQPAYLQLPVEDGVLWWRMSTFDDLAFQGRPTAPRRLEIPAAVRR